MLNPENDLRLSNVKRARQAFYGKEIASNFAQAETVSPEHVADSFGCSINLLCHPSSMKHLPSAWRPERLRMLVERPSGILIQSQLSSRLYVRLIYLEIIHLLDRRFVRCAAHYAVRSTCRK
jgi:hypothetical protein